MVSNKFKLNGVKTEAMTVGTRSRSSVSCDEHLEIGGSHIPFQHKVKRLEVVLDSNLTMCEHVSSMCRAAYLELTQKEHHPSTPH